MTELPRPFAGEVVGQFVERAVSYGAPLALAHLVSWSALQQAAKQSAALTAVAMEGRPRLRS